MSRRAVYDNWEKLVEATLKRELLRELAYCSSLSSSSSIGSTSADSSLRFDSPPLHVNELDESSSSSQGVVVVNSSTSSTGATHAGRFTARLLAAPAIALARYIRRRKPTHKFILDLSSEVDLGHFKKFPLRELQVASDNFSTKNIIRRDGFSRVYKGHLHDGSLVAIKRLKEKPSQNDETRFQTEVEIASMIVHPNLLRLLGICITPTERMLVYPYMSNGNVASFLSERPESQPPLAWSKRKSIALGSARGLAYLHDQCDLKIVHLDVKAYNIHMGEDFEAVVGDFGLAEFMDHKEPYVTTTVRGTIGHIAPELLNTGECSERTDVFGYGVILLELISGQRTFDLARLANDDNVMLLDWVQGLLKEKKLETLVDVDLQSNYIIEEVEQLIQVALLCTKGSPTERPKMSEVVRMLEGEIGSSSSTEPIIASSQGVELDASSSSSSQGVVVGCNSSTGAIVAGRFAARILAAPAISLTHIFDDPSEIELRHLKTFSLHELQVASDNFSNQNIIGRGGLGKVYKGSLADGSLVAVKRLKERPTQGEKFEFQISIVIASMTQHPNLLRLLGICITPTEIMLVYPYMSNGSLASIFRERSESRPLLDWSKRKLIAVGSARGLAYLHDQCDLKIIHRNVKAATILLDEDFEAVVGDFGLAKFMYHKDTHDAITLCGTFGHIAPEYYSSTSNFSERMDVYGYGVMLLELITGRRSLDLTRLANDAMIFDWVKRLYMEKKLETLVDAELQGNYMDEDVEKLIQVALLCTQHSPSELPKMSEVVRMLEGDDDDKENRLMKYNPDQIISNSMSNSYNTGYMSDPANPTLLIKTIGRFG